MKLVTGIHHERAIRIQFSRSIPHQASATLSTYNTRSQMQAAPL